MATAEVRVIPVTPPPREVVLTLSEDEAAVLYVVLGRSNGQLPQRIYYCLSNLFGASALDSSLFLVRGSFIEWMETQTPKNLPRLK